MKNIIVTDEIKERIKELAEEGLMDSQIAKLLNISDSSVFYWRKKLGIKSKFTYDKISKIDKEKFEELFYAGYSDYYIAKQLNMNPCSVYSHRMRHNYIRETNLRFNKLVEMSQYQKEVLIGTMLGDSSFFMHQNAANPSVSCSHCVKQKDYCLHKTEIFKSLGAKVKYEKRKTPDKRNGKFYEDYKMYIPANPAFLQLYENFYINKKKRIPKNVLKDFSEVSLAFLFMDDGYKDGTSYQLATNCFTFEDLNMFKRFLFIKFGLETTIYKTHIMRIKAGSRQRFEELVTPHIIECMQYKLFNNVS